MIYHQCGALRNYGTDLRPTAVKISAAMSYPLYIGLSAIAATTIYISNHKFTGIIKKLMNDSNNKY